MEPKQMMKQVMDFNKAAFDNTMSAMAIMQEQSEKMFNSYMEQMPWMPEEGKRLFQEWMKACKQGRENFKAATEGNYKKAEEFFTNLEERFKAGK